MAEAIVTIAMRAQTAALKKGFREMNKQLGIMGKAAKGLGTTFRRSFTEIRSGILLLQGAFNRFIGIVRELDEIAKTARRFDVGVGELRAFRLEVEKAGGSVSDATRIVDDFRKRVGDARFLRSGEAFRALEAIGLSADTLSDDIFPAMRTVARAIERLDAEYDKASARTAIFGRASRNAELALKDMDSILRQTQITASRLEFDTTSIEKMNDQVSESKRLWQQLQAQIITTMVKTGDEAEKRGAAVFAFLSSFFTLGLAKPEKVIEQFRRERDALEQERETAARLRQRQEEEAERRRQDIAVRGWSFASQRGWEISKFMENSAKWVATIPFKFEKARDALNEGILGSLTGGLGGATAFNPGTARSGGLSAFRRGQDEMRRQTSILQAIENATSISADVLQNATGVAILGTIGGI